MKPIIPIKKSDGKTVLIKEMTIGDLHRLYIWRGMYYPDQSHEEQQEWIDLFLKDLWPELTPYDREYAFMKAYSITIGRDRERAQAYCPKCESIGDMTYTIKQSNDRNLTTDIKDTNGVSLYRIHYRPPTSPGGVDGGPYGLQVLQETEYLPSEFEEYNVTPELGDKVKVSGEVIEYSPFISTSEIQALYKQDDTIHQIADIDDDTKREIRNHVASYGASSFVSFSRSPIKSMMRFKCGCGYKETKEMTRVLEFIETTVAGEMQPLFADYISAMHLAEHSHVSLSEFLNMNKVQVAMASGILAKKLKDRK